MNKTENMMPTWLEEVYQASQRNFPAWLNEERSAQWQAFSSAGLPSRKNERWKYADISFIHKNKYQCGESVNESAFIEDVKSARLTGKEVILICLLNGKFSSRLSDLEMLPKSVIVCDINEAVEKHSELLSQCWLAENKDKRHPFLSANMALFESGIFLYVPPHQRISMPIQILSIHQGVENRSVHLRNFIHIGEESALTLLEEQKVLDKQHGFINTSLSINLAARAQLHLCKLQNLDHHTACISNTQIFQQQDSQSSVINFVANAKFLREDLGVHLQQAGAVCQTAGFYHLRQNQQYVDHHVDIVHDAKNTKSEMIYKGIMDKKSRAVFNGRLLVKEGAQKIEAHQANHNLLLSNTAESYSKPELEIYADDVRCKHGATTGQLDRDAVFYMRSRGIEEVDAINILLQGFSDDVMQLIKHADIRHHIQSQITLTGDANE